MRLCDYIFKRLKELGVDHLFCLPGESVQELYRSLLGSEVKSILLSHEPSLGYAADAYSRLRGLGAVLASYGVGALNLVNAVGQAYAESSPLIVLSGGPGVMERKRHSLLHHKVRNFDSMQKVFEEVTAMSVILDSPHQAAHQLELAFQTALQFKKPVYIEIPRDMVSINVDSMPLLDPFQSLNPQAERDCLEEALSEITTLLASAKRPVILGGVEVSRIKAQKEFRALVEASGLPVATDLLGKSLIEDSHPQSLGTFFGALTNPEAERALNEADLILSLGTILSDVALGMFTFSIDRTKMVEARIESVRVKNHFFPELRLKTLIQGLLERAHSFKKDVLKKPDLPSTPSFDELAQEALSMSSTERCLDAFINRENSPAYRIVSDVGDCLFLGQALRVNRIAGFLSPAYYLSMGFGLPGGIGAQIAEPKMRSLILVGDGAFQMTGLELASLTRLGLNPIIILLNNSSYATLRLVESDPYPGSYDIGKFDYSRMADIFGGRGYKVFNTDELKRALIGAEQEHPGVFTLIDVEIPVDDSTEVLKQFGRMMGESNKVAAQGQN